MNQKFDLICQLGSQVMHKNGKYDLAPHTLIRTMASVIILNKGIAPRLMVLGGSNFGVRYDDDKIFGATHPTQKTANFTFEAFAGSDYDRKSEATVIKERIVDWLGAPHINSKRILAETLSSTTEENAAFLAIMLKRRPMFTGNEKIGILTLLYHMERAFPIFKKAGLNVEPVFAENIVVLDADAKARQTQDDIRCGDWPIDAMSVDEICQYYSTPKGGKQYPVERLRHLLSTGKSLEELMGSHYWAVKVKTDHDGISMQSGRMIVCADDNESALEKIKTISSQWDDGSCVPPFAPLHGPFKTEAEAGAAQV